MAGGTEWISAYSPFIGCAPIQNEGFTHGTNLTDVIGNVASLREEFELCLSQNPEMTFDEARNPYCKEQKAKRHRKYRYYTNQLSHREKHLQYRWLYYYRIDSVLYFVRATFIMRLFLLVSVNLPLSIDIYGMIVVLVII